MAMRYVLALMVACLFPSQLRAEMSLKIGVLNDRTGIYSDSTGEGSVVAARMAVEDFKAAQGRGLTVEVIAADHQNKPDVGSSIARKWFDEEGVDLIIDVPTSSVTLAINQITREKNKVLIVSGGGTADLTGSACSPNTVHWTYDTVALSNALGGAVVKAGGDTWFFITADYAFGHSLERDATNTILKNGGKVVGSVLAPFPNSDFSSFLLQAQSSKAKVIGLANAGGDTVTAIKQAYEFGVPRNGQRLVAFLILAPDIRSLGLETAQGLTLTEPFYWNLNDGTKTWSKGFSERFEGKMPSAAQAGVYSAILHYLKAASALNAKEGDKVVAKMKSLGTDDALFGKGEIRVDGRKMHPMHLFEVKKPAESTGPWDLYKYLASVPTEKAFRPLEEGGCPLVKQ